MGHINDLCCTQISGYASPSVGSANQKIESHEFSSDYCSMLVVPKYFLSHPETESAVTFLTDKRIFVVRVI